MKILITYFLYFLFPGIAFLQIDSSLLLTISQDTSDASLNMDAIYERPFYTSGKLPVSIGGYAEINWQHLGTDGITDGHQLQMRRMTLFVASSISERIKFLSEIELEEGGKEINIEFAAIDVEFHPMLNARAGIIMNPIGAFNQNHDGPKWEFTDRPISATQMLPATWSNAGFGFYGKHYNNNWLLGYEAYISGGLDPSIIENSENKTFLPSAKNNPDRFEEGNTLLTAKLALRNSSVGELGISYMGGVYNHFEEDGFKLDEKRRCHVFAFDFNTTLPFSGTSINAEWAWIDLDIPEHYTPQYGEKQQGGFIDIVQPIIKRTLFGWKGSTLSIACRLEYVDWNVGKFNVTGQTIGDQLWSIIPSFSFRPTQQTIFRLNYRYLEQTDFLHNPPSKTAGWSLGLSSYF